MINLLLPTDQKALRAEYRHRLFVVGGLFSFGLILIAAIIIGSFAFILAGRRNEALGQITAARRGFAGDDLAEGQQAIEEANVATKIVVAPFSSESLAAISRRLIDKRGPGIQLIRLGFSAEGAGRGEVEGKSTTRASLLKYLDALRADSHFRSVDSPIKNIIRERDITFSLAITLASPK